MSEYAKDIAIAIVGAAIGLAGLLLVFSGFVFSQADTFPPETADAVIAKYKVAGKWGLLPFGIALIDAAMAMVWLLHPDETTYTATVSGFFLALAVGGIYGFVVLVVYL